ncbi:putative ParB-like protein (nuclease) [Magnetospirillum sp. XM-1]|uniref:ParB/RepB/Spo0J family partition protein n=1 Tax=Magnetospirillum sp. XM-1 TaxID=1663591 RepID=UPI00073DEE8E|nr:ParB N-terminal domain-containing protein [Magnetospirillum sp. XM-1]CUW41100.1 putative ParB-like protein (nuclease) [Magnetospirillum sp. XM-1]
MNAPAAIDRIHSVRIADIDASGRLRKLNPIKAQLIADSILTERAKGGRGLHQPIVIRPKADGGWKLTIGLHRLNACGDVIGDEFIDSIIRPQSDDEARIAEIDENLARNELSMFDRAAFLAERDVVWKRMHPELAGKGKAGAKARWHHAKDATEKFSFASDEAAKGRINLSDAEIRKSVRMWEKLSDDSRERIPGTWLEDHQQQLRALAKLGPQQQAAILDALLRTESPALNVAAALAEVEGRKSPETDPADKAFADLVARYTRAPAAAKARFRAFIAEQGA